MHSDSALSMIFERRDFTMILPIFRRPFVKRFALCYRTVVLSVLSCPICLYVSDVGVLWLNRCMDQYETWRGGRPRLGHIVLDGYPAPLP